ncbi:MAG TPA: cohesin domain-containing protein [Candidatus Peribacterales bacterium]|nr:cohesin domain-containing protein [Candidatus Peribacterales bacterium]
MSTLRILHGRRHAVQSRCIGSIIMFLFCALMPQLSLGAEPNVEIKLRPHCESVNCPDYVQYDNETFTTYGLNVGDTVDVDVVLQNPSKHPLQSVQSWLEYDPKIIEGTDVRISDHFPLVAPGENTFSEDAGLVKLGASNVEGGMVDSEIVFARVTFRVLKESTSVADITFHEFSLLGQEGKTKALVIEEGRTVNVLKTRPRVLRLYFGDNPPPTITPVPPLTIPPANIPPPTFPPTTTTPPTFPPTAVPPVVSDPTFASLQPQGLRVMTKGEEVYLIWEALTDQRIVGYNIYYGTVTGKYIQRRTVSTATTGVTIRNLPAGSRYFFAVTGFNAMGQDSEFSYEVAVTVGDPTSSTAPFTLSQGSGDGSSTPLDGSIIGSGHVPAGTGLPLTAFIVVSFVALVASVGSHCIRKRISHPV